MLKKVAALALTLIFVLPTTMANTTNQTTDRQFEKLAKDYIEKLLQTSPEWATILGDHRFDNRLNDYSLAGVQKRRAFNEDFLNKLKAIDLARLSKANNIDARVRRDNLEYNLFQIETLREYEWNPLSYNVGGAIDSLASRDFAPLKERLTNLKGRL